MGHEAYQLAINAYLKNYEYSDATDESLFQEFQKVIDDQEGCKFNFFRSFFEFFYFIFKNLFRNKHILLQWIHKSLKQNIQVGGKVIDAEKLWMPFLRQPLYPLYEVSQTDSSWQLTQKEGPFLHNPESISELPSSDYNYKYPMIIR